MIKRAGTFNEEIRPNMLGGKGEVKLMHLMEGGEFQGKGRLFSINTIKPGCSIGSHQHKGDVEAYYVLKGEATYYDNGERTILKPGDMAFTDNMQSHGIENEGTEDVEVLALILYA
ncbi:MAG: cupin domain-containing protein [Veillonellaceae bacterium]|jgi:quercetin dioxygenase-like cupin family protein|nr:cupin domain-containing protein [Veillonellaceae bacterium]